MSAVLKIQKQVLYGDFDGAVAKCLWRQSGGNREKAYNIIKETAKHYGFTPTDMDIDIALGEMNNGVEMEWRS